MKENNPNTEMEMLKDHIIYSRIANCGDFQIAHKEIWKSIRGFEEEMYKSAVCTDTNVQKKAVLAGYELYVDSIPFVFHISHEERSVWKNGNTNANLLIEKNFTKTTNKEQWGFSDRGFNMTEY